MSVIVSYPGTFQDAQQAARAFHEQGQLTAFVTALVFNEDNIIRRLSEVCLPAKINRRLAKEFRRREITEIPTNCVISYPWLDGLRTVLSKYSGNPVLTDLAWDAMARRFDATVARDHLRHAKIVYGFEYTSQRTFERAKAEGIATVLAVPSLDSKEFEKIKAREEAQFPELMTKHHDYFDRRFPVRYERRRAEIAMADLIVANSSLTRDSHIRAGADPKKIVSVPLAAPRPIAANEIECRSAHNSLSVAWAGTFSIRKGAHYFLDCWRALQAGERACARVYGAIDLPERILRSSPEGVTFAGSIPQQELFAEFTSADVLVFPTLSDGFGGVVLEAFSRGLPVITTKAGGASEFVEHGKNGLLVPPADSAALTDALQWCLDNREALHRMRFAALETARRWQWSDYRRALIVKIATGLRAADYAVDFAIIPQAIGAAV